jgi:hypothetical protein
MKGHRSVTLFALLVSILIATASPTGAMAQSSTGKYAKIAVGSDYNVNNNIWGSATGSQRIFVDDEAGFPAGWTFSWSQPKTVVVSYPHINFGQSPSNPFSTTDQLPVQLRYVKDLRVDMAYSSRMEGKGNLAFDIWIHDGFPVNKANIRTELMVWMHSVNNMVPGRGSYFIETVVIDGDAYELWANADNSYIALLREYGGVADFDGSVNLGGVLSHLVASGRLSKTAWLGSIPFGQEVMSGSGGTTFNRYETYVNRWVVPAGERLEPTSGRFKGKVKLTKTKPSAAGEMVPFDTSRRWDVPKTGKRINRSYFFNQVSAGDRVKASIYLRGSRSAPLVVNIRQGKKNIVLNDFQVAPEKWRHLVVDLGELERSLPVEVRVRFGAGNAHWVQFGDAALYSY